jgi:regulatory protein
MEPHRPPRSRNRDARPLDAAWLEGEAVNALARSDQSRRKLVETVRRKLSARCERTGEDGETLSDRIPEIVERLAERGYVDDGRLAAHLFEKGRGTGRSRAWIENQLRAKGIDEETLRDVQRSRSLEATGDATDEGGGHAHTDEVEAAFRIARKKRLGPYCPDPDQRIAERQRHLGFLARRGFSSDIAHHVIDAELTP